MHAVPSHDVRRHFYVLKRSPTKRQLAAPFGSAILARFEQAVPGAAA